MSGGHYVTVAKVEPRRTLPVRTRYGERATHVLVDERLTDALRHLSRVTRVSQAQYLREAVADLLAKYEGRRSPVVDFHLQAARLVSVVFRLDPAELARVAALAARTRIRQSEYMREAIVDLLAKHGCPWGAA